MTERLPAPSERRRQTPAVSARARAIYLECLAAGFSKAHAAAQAGSRRQRFWELAKADDEFATLEFHAYEEGSDRLEDEARRRGFEGVERPVTVAGQREVVLEYSDRLLELLLRGRRPAVYGQQPVKVEAAPVTVRHEHRLTLDDVAAFAQEHGLVGGAGGQLPAVRPQGELTRGEQLENPESRQRWV